MEFYLNSNYTAPRERIVLRNYDADAAAVIARDVKVSPALAGILAGRGLKSFDECKHYFRPTTDDFLDPFLVTEMGAAVDRIIRSIQEKESVVIHGDYDVDGVTATALLTTVLTRLGANVSYVLPDRILDGYGLSVTTIERVASEGAKLIITVDCGVTAFSEVARANELGVDVIVTDHHEPHGELPQAVAVLDHKIPGSTYPEQILAGVGMALKLSQALAIRTDFGPSLWSDLLDIAALGTAADIVPMRNENRIICHIGFSQMRTSQSIGLRALIRQQKLADKDLSTADVVFLLAPCINAAGRLGDSTRGVRLLLTHDEGEAELWARELVEVNLERRALDKGVQEDAAAWVRTNIDLATTYGIVAASKNWHQGVIGIAASKIAETFTRPTVLLSIDKNGVAKGSARSAVGIHLLDALALCEDLFTRFGGHAAAAGVTMPAANIPAFCTRFSEAVAQQIEMKDLVPRVHADVEATFGDLTPQFFRIVKQMEPFGPGNMRPVLLARGLTHKAAPKLAGKSHVKCKFSQGPLVMDAIAFNFATRLKEISSSQSLSAAFTLDENEWNGSVSLQMKIKGVEI